MTVHFVDDGVDTGPIILQEAVTLPYTRDQEEILTALHRTEHELLPRAIRLFAAGGVRIDADNPRFVHVDEGVLARRMGELGPSGALTAPGVSGDLRIERALLTVYDKRGVVDFARALAELGVEIISTGGTAAELGGAGIDVRSIEDYTGFPEILDGRVKTLHPSIFAGLLAVRSREEHRETLAEHGIAPIDLVVVNLYPFERTAARRGVSDEEVIEHIDIGGPTLIRAAAKNHAHVGVVVRPESYDAVIEELSETGGVLSAQTRESLATEAFGATARYDAAISRWFAEREDDFPNHFVAAFEKVLDLSYGENPHQRAAYYEQVGMRTHLLARTVKVHGKELSFNNLLDLDSGRALLREFEVPAAAIIKHNNPCGVAVGETIAEAYERALACDPQSAYGGVVVLNRDVDAELAPTRLRRTSSSCCSPPATRTRRSTCCARSRACASSRTPSAARRTPGERDMRKVMGGVMLQDRDTDLQERARHGGRDRAQADRGGVGRAAVRVEGRASTCARTRSCCHATSARSASAPAR